MEKDKFTKYSIYNMKNVMVKSDRGLLGLNDKTQILVDKDNFDESNVPYVKSKSKNWEINMKISASQQELVIIRKYFSLITMLSKIGGISKILMVVFALFYLNYNRSALKQSILDSFIDTTDKALPAHFLNLKALKAKQKENKEVSGQIEKLPSRFMKSEAWILENGTEMEKKRIVVRRESKKLVTKQMDFVDVVQKGILQDAYYEALYPAMFKTLIPVAYINKVSKDIKQQMLLEGVQKQRLAQLKRSGSSSSFFGSLIGGGKTEDVKSKEELEEDQEIKKLINSKKKGVFEKMSYEEAIEILRNEELPTDPRLQKIKKFLMKHLPVEMLGEEHKDLERSRATGVDNIVNKFKNKMKFGGLKNKSKPKPTPENTTEGLDEKKSSPKKTENKPQLEIAFDKGDDSDSSSSEDGEKVEETDKEDGPELSNAIQEEKNEDGAEKPQLEVVFDKGDESDSSNNQEE